MPSTLNKSLRLKKKRQRINGTEIPSRTLADLVHELGDVPLHRILLIPSPGTATEADLIRLMDGDPKRLCELVNGTLVEKAMGLYESRICMMLGAYLVKFVEEHRLGFVTGEAGAYRMKTKKVRMPDLSFVSTSNTSDQKTHVKDTPSERCHPILQLKYSANQTPRVRLS